MTRAERIKALKEEMSGRDYEGVTTVASSCIFDLLAEYKRANWTSAKAINALAQIANLPECSFSFHKLFVQAQGIAVDAIAELSKSEPNKSGTK